MHAFGLEETNFYREAEKQARKVVFCVSNLRFQSQRVSPFTPVSAESKIDKFSKLTNCVKLKANSTTVKCMLNSFPMSGHTLVLCS